LALTQVKHREATANETYRNELAKIVDAMRRVGHQAVKQLGLMVFDVFTDRLEQVTEMLVLGPNEALAVTTMGNFDAAVGSVLAVRQRLRLAYDQA